MLKNKKSFLLIVAFFLVVLVVSGISYAFFNYAQTFNNSELVVGDVYLNYITSKNINLMNVSPRSKLDENTYMEFTINGLNERKTKDLYYEIDLMHGEIPNNKTEDNRLADEFLRFTLVKKIDNGNEEVVLNDIGFPDINDKRIYVETIAKDTSNERSHTYKLYVWVTDEIEIGNLSGSDYSMSEWNDLFASIKVKVIGEYVEKEFENNSVKVKFDPNGGILSQTFKYYNKDDVFGTLPTPTREGYEFRGWEIVGGGMAESDNLVFFKGYQHNSDYVFNGTNYIDTGVYLFSRENYKRNFYISIDIKQNVSTENQATLIGSKYEADTTNYPGFVFRRRADSLSYNISANVSASNKITLPLSGEILGSFDYTKKVRLLRINNILYYSLNNESFKMILDYTGFNLFFNQSLTIGATFKGDGKTLQRFFKGTMSNIIVTFLDDKATLSNFTNHYYHDEGDIELKAKWEKVQFKVTFDPNGGTLNTEPKYYNIGEEFGELPIPKRDGYIFDGWKVNILDVNNIKFSARQVGISIDEDGYIYDDTPYNDERNITNWDQANWILDLIPGKYELDIQFLRKVTVEHDSEWTGNSSYYYLYYPYLSILQIYSETSSSLYEENVRNKARITKEFNFSSNAQISVLLKVFDGLADIKFYKSVSNNDVFNYNDDKVLIAKWIPE